MNDTQSGVSLETVAVITVAVAAAMDKPLGSFVITGIQPAAAVPASSGWAQAGILESHLTRRQFGLRR